MGKTHKQILKQLSGARKKALKKLEKLDEGFSPNVKVHRQIKRALKINKRNKK